MKHEKNRKLTAQMTEQFHLPKDLILGEAIVTILGQRDLTVENYRGILAYESDKIRLSLKHGQIEISGRALNIDYYTNDDMKISGNIQRVEYGL
ncbi:MAG: YabP/YqfC family sporulation protein [Clostridiales bacterium]|nr:YabP/YqfC family sporulation protein [Clostridiales bacterium]